MSNKIHILVYPFSNGYTDMFDINSILKNKNKETVALLYQRYGKKLYGYAITKWKFSEDDSWELVYKTLYKAMNVSDRYSFKDEGKFIGFLFKIFINYLRNHYNYTKAKGIATTELLESHEKLSSDRTETDEEREFYLRLCIKEKYTVKELAKFSSFCKRHDLHFNTLLEFRGAIDQYFKD